MMISKILVKFRVVKKKTILTEKDFDFNRIKIDFAG